MENLETVETVQLQEKKKYKHKPITPEKNREAYLRFIAKNADKLKQTINCEICGGRYTYYNKSRHERIEKHTHVANLLKKFNPPNENN